MALHIAPFLFSDQHGDKIQEIPQGKIGFHQGSRESACEKGKKTRASNPELEEACVQACQACQKGGQACSRCEKGKKTLCPSRQDHQKIQARSCCQNFKKPRGSGEKSLCFHPTRPQKSRCPACGLPGQTTRSPFDPQGYASRLHERSGQRQPSLPRGRQRSFGFWNAPGRCRQRCLRPRLCA